jgi:hypothetical protein
MERDLTPSEDAARTAFLNEGAYRFNDLIDASNGNGSYFRVRAYIFNGRRENAWDISVDHVNVEIVGSSSVAAK